MPVTVVAAWVVAGNEVVTPRNNGVGVAYSTGADGPEEEISIAMKGPISVSIEESAVGSGADGRAGATVPTVGRLALDSCFVTTRCSTVAPAAGSTGFAAAYVAACGVRLVKPLTANEPCDGTDANACSRLHFGRPAACCNHAVVFLSDALLSNSPFTFLLTSSKLIFPRPGKKSRSIGSSTTSAGGASCTVQLGRGDCGTDKFDAGRLPLTTYRLSSGCVYCGMPPI